MSFEPEVGAWFAEHHRDVRRGIVLDGRDEVGNRTDKLKRSEAQFIALNVDSAGEDWVAEARRDAMDIACWTVRTPEQRTFAAAHADALIWEADGRS
jgi:glycerophosphoryl diester phosphodiesterase